MVTISVTIHEKAFEIAAMTNGFLILGSRVQVAQGAPDFTSRGLGEVGDGWFGVSGHP
jgi:hypothetical protein